MQRAVGQPAPEGTESAGWLPPPPPPGFPAPGYTPPYTSTYNPFAGSYGPFLFPAPPQLAPRDGTAPTVYAYVGGALHAFSLSGPSVGLPPFVPAYALPSPYGPPTDIYGSRYPYASVYINGVWYKPWEIPIQLSGRGFFNPYDPSAVHAFAGAGFGAAPPYLPGFDLYGSRYPYASVYINGVWYKPWEVPHGFGGGLFPPGPYAGSVPVTILRNLANPYAAGPSALPVAGILPLDLEPAVGGSGFALGASTSGAGGLPPQRALAALPALASPELSGTVSGGWPNPYALPRTGIFGLPSRVRVPALGEFAIPPSAGAVVAQVFGLDRLARGALSPDPVAPAAGWPAPMAFDPLPLAPLASAAPLDPAVLNAMEAPAVWDEGYVDTELLAAGTREAPQDLADESDEASGSGPAARTDTIQTEARKATARTAPLQGSNAMVVEPLGSTAPGETPPARPLEPSPFLDAPAPAQRQDPLGSEEADDLAAAGMGRPAVSMSGQADPALLLAVLVALTGMGFWGLGLMRWRRR